MYIATIIRVEIVFFIIIKISWIFLFLLGVCNVIHSWLNVLFWGQAENLIIKAKDRIPSSHKQKGITIWNCVWSNLFFSLCSLYIAYRLQDIRYTISKKMIDMVSLGNDRAKRHCFFTTTLVILFPFSLPT